MTLDQVEEKTRIKKRLLKLIEEEKFSQFSSEAYLEGFVKNYAQFLDLPVEKILAIFRRQFKKERKKTAIFKESISQKSFFSLTPKKIKWALVLLIIICFFGYLFFQYQNLIFGPRLVVLKPSENAIVHQERIIIQGKTSPEAQVFVNEEKVYPNQKGEFFQEIFLSEGENQIVIIAQGQRGRKRTIVREVTFENY